MPAIINLPSTEDIGKLFSEKIPGGGIKTPSLKYGEKIISESAQEFFDTVSLLGYFYLNGGYWEY